MSAGRLRRSLRIDAAAGGSITFAESGDLRRLRVIMVPAGGVQPGEVVLTHDEAVSLFEISIGEDRYSQTALRVEKAPPPPPRPKPPAVEGPPGARPVDIDGPYDDEPEEDEP